MSRVCARVRRAQHLASLNLNYNRLDDECLAMLAGGVGANGNLTALYLVGNAFKIVGTRALAMAIERNSSLTHLDLRQNAIAEFGGSALGASGARAGCVGRARWLSLWSASPRRNGALPTVLVRACRCRVCKEPNPPDTHPAHCQVAGAGATLCWRRDAGLDRSSARCDTHRATHQELVGHIEMESLGFKWAAACRALVHVCHACALACSRCTPTLECAYSSHKIGDVDAYFIGTAIAGNQGTQSLLLDDDDITDTGCRALAKGLTGHKSIRVLSLRRAAFAEKGCEVCANTRSLTPTVVAQTRFRADVRDLLKCSRRAPSPSTSCCTRRWHCDAPRLEHTARRALRSFADTPFPAPVMGAFVKGLLGNRVLRTLELVGCGIGDVEGAPCLRARSASGARLPTAGSSLAAR